MASGTNLPVDGGRLWDDLTALARITDPGKPYTRRCFTPLFLEGRSWLAKKLENAGLEVRIDEGGNLIGRCVGERPELGTIMIGSHSDTVSSGGRFDGIAGVLAGLEVLRSLRESGIRLRHSVELVDFLSEEPSEYGLSCVGSRAMTRRVEPDMLALCEPGGERLDDAIRRMGGDPDRFSNPARDDISAYVELHIEQGQVLEASGTDIGIVSSIVGIIRIEVVLEGEADHAGTTPLRLRKDASVAAAAIVTAVRSEAEARDIPRTYFVATTGVIVSEPNAANVVPQRVRLVIDARSEDQRELEEFVLAIDRASARAAELAKVSRRQFKILSRSKPSNCDVRIRKAMKEAADDQGVSVQDMASGAGHDAAFVSLLAPMGMIFVPSRAGKSHCPEEWTEPDQLAAGAAVLLRAICRIDEETFVP